MSSLEYDPIGKPVGVSILTDDVKNICKLYARSTCFWSQMETYGPLSSLSANVPASMNSVMIQRELSTRWDEWYAMMFG